MLLGGVRNLKIRKCAVPEKYRYHPPCHRRSMEIPSGGELQRPKFLKKSMEVNWNFPEW